jgi:hypothetical protein
MNEIKTEILIHASPEKVWEVLMDFPRYPEWNPLIKSIAGETKPGSRLKIFIHPPESFGMTIQPKVLKLEPQKEFRWKGQLFFKGLFDGEHYFHIEELGKGSVRFIHGEKFSGILIPLFGNMLRKTEVGFRQMNEELKKRCEG